MSFHNAVNSFWDWHKVEVKSNKQQWFQNISATWSIMEMTIIEMVHQYSLAKYDQICFAILAKVFYLRQQPIFNPLWSFITQVIQSLVPNRISYISNVLETWTLTADIFLVKYNNLINIKSSLHVPPLTHWGRKMHICIDNLTINASENLLVTWLALSHYLNQCWNTINWTQGTNFSEIVIEIHTFSFKKTHLKMSSSKWSPFCLGLNVLSKMAA